MRWTYWPIVSALLGFSVVSLGVPQNLRAESEASKPAGPAVMVQVVEQKSTDLTIDIVGDVRAYREVDLRSRVNGNLINIDFAPGQRVKKGDLLFEIDPGPYETALANAKAGLAQASASYARVQQDVERYKPLLPDNAIPRQVYDQAVAQAAQEAAVVESQKAALERVNFPYLFYTFLPHQWRHLFRLEATDDNNLTRSLSVLYRPLTRSLFRLESISPHPV